MSADDGPSMSGGAGGLSALLIRCVEVSATAVTIVDLNGPDQPLIYVNRAFERTTGFRAADVLGRNCRFLQGPDSEPRAVSQIGQAVASGHEYVGVLRNYRKDGTAWWNELRLSPVCDEKGLPTHYLGFQNDVSDRIEAENRLAHLAFHDELTGLPNRALLMQQLDRAIVDARRSGHRLTLLFIDLDGFKDVNDRLGHAAGDLALTATGLKLRLALREGDLLGRYGGDEFIAVLADVPAGRARSVAQRAADALVESFSRPLDLGTQPAQLGVSIGVAIFPENGDNAEQLVHAADEAMYEAKNGGRAKAVLAPPASTRSTVPSTLPRRQAVP